MWFDDVCGSMLWTSENEYFMVQNASRLWFRFTFTVHFLWFIQTNFVFSIGIQFHLYTSYFGNFNLLVLEAQWQLEARFEASISDYISQRTTFSKNKEKSGSYFVHSVSSHWDIICTPFCELFGNSNRFAVGKKMFDWQVVTRYECKCSTTPI